MGLRSHIPKAVRANIGDAGRKAEARIGKGLGARMRPASGAMAEAKGDMQVGDFLIEVKSTVAKSMQLQYDWLGKISVEALAEGKSPALVISYTDHKGKPVNYGEWVLVPMSVFREMASDD